MRLISTRAFAGALFATATLVSGCDLVQPSDDGPPASITGEWTTGLVDVSIDTSFTIDGDPTYASVQIAAVYHIETSMQLTDTNGDVRGKITDYRAADWQIGYVRQDGVVVREPGQVRIGGGVDDIEAVYIAPTLTVTRPPFYDYDGEFDGRTFDFSDRTAAFERRRLSVDVNLPRLGNRSVTLTRRGVGTTFRPVGTT